MAARDELAAILRVLQAEEVVPDDLMIEHIVSLVGTDRLLAIFTLDIVNHLLGDHEDIHGVEGARDCERCTALEDIARDLTAR